MTAKILSLLALLVLSLSAANGTFLPQFPLAPSSAIAPQFLPPVCASGYQHPIVQLALATSILQQPFPQFQQQPLPQIIVQAVAAHQQQQLLPILSELVLANPAIQPALTQLAVSNPVLLPALSQLALANPALLPALSQVALANPTFLPSLIQLALANPALLPALTQLAVANPGFLQALSQLALTNPAFNLQQQLLPFIQQVVANLQRQQWLQFNPLALANPAAHCQQQQLLPLNPLAAANPLAATFLQQPQLLPWNPISLINPALSWQQPIF